MNKISLKQTFKEIKDDLPNPSIYNFISYYLFNPNFRILLNYRIGRFFYNKEFRIFKTLAKYYRMRLITKRNCDISYKCYIGKNLRLPHPLGIVIGEGVVIKDNVTLWQHVTLGNSGKCRNLNCYPVIENNVRIYSSANVVGNITVGEYSIVAANAFVNKNIPRLSTAIGIPAKVFKA